MLRANYKTLVLVPAIVIGYAACVGEDSSDDPTAGAEAALADLTAESVTRTPILGTFRNESAPTGIAVLTLKSDWSYHKQEALVCVRYPCVGPQTNGLYRLMQRDGASYLVLMDDAGGAIERYSLLLKGDALYLEKSGEQRQTLQRSDCSWCAMPIDCTLQDLDVGPCAGEWTCASNACNYVCRGMTSPPKEANSCTASPDPTE
jgi:hypothetical protein